MTNSYSTSVNRPRRTRPRRASRPPGGAAGGECEGEQGEGGQCRPFPGKEQGKRFREQIAEDLLAKAHEAGAQITATAANQEVANLYVEQFAFLKERGWTWR